MRRSLHVKLTLIMMLLILSLMTVVGSFLINSVMGFYIDDFYSQIATAFGQENVDFVRALQTPTEGETDGAAMIDQVLEAYSGSLGVDSRNRNYYVLDGVTAAYLAGSLPQAPEHGVVITPISKPLCWAKPEIRAIPPPTTWMPPFPSPGERPGTSCTFWTTARLSAA